MTVVVLDPRWPDMIPAGMLATLEAPIEVTEEVPHSARGQLQDLPAQSTGHLGTLFTTDPTHPQAAERIGSGEEVVKVPSLADPIHEAVQVMTQARDRGAWEAAQTHESLLPYLEEEAQEFADAVRAGQSDDALLKELGDVFLQVLFHAEIASRRHAFTLADVAASFTAKMRSRSPYLFDGSTGIVTVEEQDRLWQEGKAREQTG